MPLDYETRLKNFVKDEHLPTDVFCRLVKLLERIKNGSRSVPPDLVGDLGALQTRLRNTEGLLTHTDIKNHIKDHLLPQLQQGAYDRDKTLVGRMKVIVGYLKNRPKISGESKKMLEDCEKGMSLGKRMDLADKPEFADASKYRTLYNYLKEPNSTSTDEEVQKQLKLLVAAFDFHPELLKEELSKDFDRWKQLAIGSAGIIILVALFVFVNASQADEPEKIAGEKTSLRGEVLWHDFFQKAQPADFHGNELTVKLGKVVFSQGWTYDGVVGRNKVWLTGLLINPDESKDYFVDAVFLRPLRKIGLHGQPYLGGAYDGKKGKYLAEILCDSRAPVEILIRNPHGKFSLEPNRKLAFNFGVEVVGDCRAILLPLQIGFRYHGRGTGNLFALSQDTIYVAYP